MKREFRPFEVEIYYGCSYYINRPEQVNLLMNVNLHIFHCTTHNDNKILFQVCHGSAAITLYHFLLEMGITIFSIQKFEKFYNEELEHT